jgi:hypothetical protein
VSRDSNQIQLSASSRGIGDDFFCFTCDEYVWDCDHLIEERVAAAQFPALNRRSARLGSRGRRTGFRKIRLGKGAVMVAVSLYTRLSLPHA